MEERQGGLLCSCTARLRAVETCTTRNPNVWSHLLQLKHLIRKFRRLGRVKSIPPALHLRLPPRLNYETRSGCTTTFLSFVLRHVVIRSSTSTPSMLITRQFPPIAFSAFFSPKELGFQVHSKPNFERLILKFREDRFVHAMFSNCSTANIFKTCLSKSPLLLSMLCASRRTSPCSSISCNVCQFRLTFAHRSRLSRSSV